MISSHRKTWPRPQSFVACLAAWPGFRVVQFFTFMYATPCRRNSFPVPKPLSLSTGNEHLSWPNGMKLRPGSHFQEHVAIGPSKSDVTADVAVLQTSYRHAYPKLDFSTFNIRSTTPDLKAFVSTTVLSMRFFEIHQHRVTIGA